MQLFANHLEGTFVSRPNRYIVTVATASGIVRAHCPNPGRLAEILFTGTPIILERAGNASQRKTEWTAVAAIHSGNVVPLVAHRANAIARELILPHLFPRATQVAAERPLGAGRVDFVVYDADGWINVEVKSCTLVEQRVAMFPDAPSDRATRHIEELVQATSSTPTSTDTSTDASTDTPASVRGLVLLVISHGDPSVFVPNVHTDPEFSGALATAAARSAGAVDVRAVYVSCDREGGARLENPDVSVDLRPAELVENDGGAYLLFVYLQQETMLKFGLHHSQLLKPGYYVYVGSALRGLTARLARHRRKRKNHHWHIDDLLDVGALIGTFPVLTRSRIEQTLATEVGEVADGQVPGFGSTDSPLPSHLFFFSDDPAARRDFTEVLFRHRHTDIFNSIIKRTW